MRRRAAAVTLALLIAGQAAADGVTAARYDVPTTRYDHGILGDAVEWGALVLETETGRLVRIVLSPRRVFEDIAPRLYDVDGDGGAEAIVVETDLELGARLAVYGPRGLVSATPFIGAVHRWLAPAGVGAADLNGDGAVELAFVDRPHLAKTLRVFRFERGSPVLIAELPGVTNHRIGESDIAGGIRDCGAGPEIVVADADWQRVLAVRLEGATLTARDLGPHEGRQSFAAAMACRL